MAADLAPTSACDAPSSAACFWCAMLIAPSYRRSFIEASKFCQLNKGRIKLNG